MSKYDFGYNIEENRTNRWAFENVEVNSRVLELGPAGGTLTKSLYEKKKCHIDIVELDEQDGKLAAQYAEKAVVGTNGNLNLDYWYEVFSENRYDYIVALDVLEHLANPEHTLRKASKLLKPTGKILLSVPNVAHNAVIIELLQNRFTYGRLGLLDNTHIHFFAYESICQMLKNVGLYINKQEAVLKCVSDTELPSRYEDLGAELGHLLKQRKYGEVYQYLLELSFNSEQKTIDLLGNGQIKEPIYARILPDGESQNEISVEIQEGWNEVTVELPKDYLMKSIRFIPYEGSGIVEHLQIIGYGNSESEMSYNWTSAQKLGNESFFVHLGNHMNEMNYLINEEYSALKIKYRLVPFYGERELYAAECFQKEIVKSGKREESLQEKLRETDLVSKRKITDQKAEIESLRQDKILLKERIQKEMEENERREEALRQDKTLLKEHFQTLQVLVEEIKHGKLWKIFDLIREVEK